MASSEKIELQPLKDHQVSFRSKAKPRDVEELSPPAYQLTDNAYESKDEKVYKETVQILNTLINMMLVFSFLVFVTVAAYLCFLIPTQFLWHTPEDKDTPELRPSIIAIIAMECILCCSTCMLLALRRTTEGKVIMFMITTMINGVLSGFALLTVFQKLLYGLVPHP